MIRVNSEQHVLFESIDVLHIFVKVQTLEHFLDVEEQVSKVLDEEYGLSLYIGQGLYLELRLHFVVLVLAVLMFVEFNSVLQVHQLVKTDDTVIFVYFNDCLVVVFSNIVNIFLLGYELFHLQRVDEFEILHMP